MTLKEIRKSQNIKQEAVAYFLKTKQNTISQWETGKCEPSTKNIVKLSEILKVSISEIVFAIIETQKQKEL